MHSVTNADKRAAEREAYQLKLRLVEAQRVHDKIVTLRQLCEEWVRKNEKRLSPSTVAGYNVIIRNRAQSIMDIPARGITQARWEAAMEEDAQRLASKTMKSSYSFLSNVLHDMTGVRFSADVGEVRSKERGFLDYEEIQILLPAIRGLPLEIPILMALSSLRRSEILAMTWDKIDLKKGMMRVQGAVVMDKNHKQVFKQQNKTELSTRYLPIIAPLQEALEAEPDKTGKVCKTANDNLARKINLILRDLDLPQVGCHGLRHSFASLCYHLGVPEKVAQEMGGWSDSGTMHKIYTHIAQKDRDHYSGEFLAFFEQGQNASQNKSQIESRKDDINHGKTANGTK